MRTGGDHGDPQVGHCGPLGVTGYAQKPSMIGVTWQLPIKMPRKKHALVSGHHLCVDDGDPMIYRQAQPSDIVM